MVWRLILLLIAFGAVGCNQGVSQSEFTKPTEVDRSKALDGSQMYTKEEADSKAAMPR